MPESGVFCAIVSSGGRGGRSSGGAASAPAPAGTSGGDPLFGFAVFDEECRAFQVCEYHDDSQLSRSEALLLQVQPKVCCTLLPDADLARRLARVCESCAVECEDVKGSELKQVDVEQDLLRLLVDAPECGLGRHLEEQRRKHAMRALSVLLGKWQLLQEPANFGACTLGLYPLATFMHLDKAAFSAMNVLPRPDESIRSANTLLGFLNRCSSSVGSRRLRQWLTQPLTAAQEIRKRHDVVEALSRAEGLLRQVEQRLRRVPDLDRMASRFHCTSTAKSKRTKASLEDMVLLYHCLLSADKLLEALDTYDGAHAQVLSETVTEKLRSLVTESQNYRVLVERTLDLKQAEQRNYCISTTFDNSLVQLASKRDQVKEQMEAVRQTVERDLGLLPTRNERPVSLVECPEGQAFRVTKKNQQGLQNQKGKSAKYKVLAFKKIECIFTTPELEKLNRQLKEAKDSYEAASEMLVVKTLSVASTYAPVVGRLAEVLGNLDVLAAFARVVVTAPCNFVRAEIDEEGQKFAIQGAVHLLLVANSEKAFVANDLAMAAEQSRLHIITGPNMGGKSTYIRSVALIALLNQVGCFVPCRAAVLPIFDAIMCRVGASDMQLRGISTFMAEMLEAACILNTATRRSLVIVDELGRGTSTSDGFGIAWSIAQHLVEETRCFTLFATHFHELAALEEAVPGVRNRHATAVVDASSGQLTFLYALEDGPADQSYGAHVAELAGFPAPLVEDARRRARDFEAESGFSQAAKKQRLAGEGCHAAATAETVAYLMAARDENEFVRRAMEQLPRMQGAAAA